MEIRLFATLREGREKVFHISDINIKNGFDLAEKLKIPKEEIAIFLINGRHSKLDANLKDDDIIAIFPPVGGG